MSLNYTTQPGPGLSILLSGRARAGPGPQIIFAGRASVIIRTFTCVFVFPIQTCVASRLAVIALRVGKAPVKAALAG